MQCLLALHVDMVLDNEKDIGHPMRWDTISLVFSLFLAIDLEVYMLNFFPTDYARAC